MRKLSFVLGAAFSVFFAVGASAATVLYTEGNGNNRALVAGSIDLEDASPGGAGFDLGSYDAGDTLGIYGRIVGSVDRFTFNVNAAFDIVFDFDGYDLDGGGSVVAGLSGLIMQSVAVGGGDPVTEGLGKGVTISLFQEAIEIASRTYSTNETSLTSGDNTIFGGLAAGTYTLIVDGSDGPKKSKAALYDIEIAAVPLPMGALLLVTGLGAFGLVRRKT